MKKIASIIKIKRKFNHAKAKKVTTSASMRGGVFNIPVHRLSFEEAEAQEKENLKRQFGQGDKRNWG